MNNRVREIRKSLNLTMEKFGERLGVTRTAISNIESGNRGVTDQMFKAICREFNVNEDYLRYGNCDMFKKIPEEDETAAIVSDLLENGKDNPFYEIILEIVNTYKESSPKSQDVLKEFSVRLLDNLRKKKEG